MKRIPNIVKIAFIVVLYTAAMEFAIMTVIEVTGLGNIVPHFTLAVLDTLTLSMFVVPFIYLFVVRPIQKHERSRSSELNKLRKAVETSGEVMFMTDLKGVFTYVNPEFTRLYGYAPEEVIGKVTPKILKSSKMDSGKYKAFWEAVLSKQVAQAEMINAAKDGRLVIVEESANPILDDSGEVIGLFAIQKDISEEKQSALKIRQLNRLYEMITHVNHIHRSLTFIQDKNKLFEETCRHIVESGLLKMAWIGVPDYKERLLKPVAYSGFEDGYLGEIRVSMDDIPEGRGPGGMAYREKRPFVYNDIQNNHGALLWHEEALKRGYHSVGVFPLMAKEYVFGIICLYAVDADFFGEGEIKILSSLTEHIAFAVEAMERDQLRRQLGTSLAETEERLRSIINNSSAVIYVKDIKEKFIMVNRQFEESCHINAGQIAGKSDHDIFPEEIADALVANDRKVLSLRTPLEVEETVLMDGKLRTYISVKFPLFDAEGIPYAVCGISTDITERKKMEEALRKSESSLAEAQKMAAIGNWDWDMVNDKVHWSEELYHILGFSREEGMTYTYESSYNALVKIIHAADAERIKRMIDIAMSEKKPFKEEFRIVVPDGRTKVIYMQAVFICGESGNPVRMSGTIQDITERRNAEESVQLLQSITTELNDAGSLGLAMEIILRKVSIATGWVYGEIWMPKAGGKWLEDNVAIYKADDVLDDFNVKSKDTVFPVGIGIPGKVFQDGNPLWIKDVTKNPDFIRGNLAQEAGLKTAMAIPVFVGKEIVAVMIFFAFKERQEDERLISMVTSVAAQLGQVIKRKMSEEELRKSESSLVEAQRIAHIGNWDWDIAKNELLWSDEVYRIFGLKPHEFELTFESFLERVYPEDRDFVKGSVQAALKKESDYRIDHRILMPDKTERYIYEQAKVLFNDDGTAARMIGTVQDITERKKAEEEMRMLQSITLLVNDSTTLDDAYRITLRAVCSAIGWAYGEIWVPDEGNKFLLYSQTWHGSYKELEKFRFQGSGEFSFPSGIGIPGAVFLLKQPRWVRDISLAKDFVQVDGAKDVGFMTCMAIPVVADNEVVAVMVFCSFESRDEDEHIMDMVVTVSTQLGTVLQRKKTEKALKVSEDRYRAIFETTGNATVIVDEKDRILLANREFVKLSGYAREEIENSMTFKKFVVEDDWKKIYDYHVTRRIVSKGVPRHYEFRLANKKGEIRDIYMSTSVIPETGKSVASLLDITEFKKISESLRKSEERYRRFFEEDLAGDFILSSDGRIISCNPAFARIFGFESDKCAADFDFFSLFADAAAKEEFLARLGLEKKLENCEVELKRTDGREVFIIANVVGDFDSHGGLAGIKGYVFDNTERKKIEDQLRQSQKIEAIGRLAGGIAHDFNNLLTIISGYNSMLMNTVDRNDPRFGYVEQMQNAAERASALTRQLLAFSRKQILSPQVLDINAVIVNIEKMLRRIILENIELKTVLKPQTGRIKADPGQIEQVIMNLSVNARDAMPNGGVLTIGTDSVRIDEADRHSDMAAGDYIMLTVSDTGTGMSDEVKSHIFEPFFTTKEQGKGTGLGLSTVYGIVKQSGGHVVVYSEPGIGTTFKIYLPGIPEEAVREDNAAQKNEQPALKHGSESILLVEDDKGVYSLITAVLQDNGYDVHGANNGAEALKFIQAYTGKPIQLLITDVVMPQMSGGELAKHIGRIMPDLKVLFMSGYTDDDIVHHGVLDEGLMFIQKPFTPASFLTKVREVLDRNDLRIKI
ncbi:MAG: PAS domain S-box protein [Planctomycetes bacterium]|nr:PAS domain S-box protein [Planctomycetota bacterium]